MDVNYLQGHTKAVNSTTCSLSHIWSCSRDLTIKQWSASSGECISTVENAHSMNITSITLAKDASVLASGSRDYSVKTWDASTVTCTQTYKVPRNIVTALRFDETGNMLFQGSEDLCVRGWDVRAPARQPTIHLTGFVYFPLCLDLSSDGLLLATGCKGFDAVGCDVKIWDLRRLTALTSLKGHTQDVKSCIFLPQSSQLLSISKDASCGLWDVSRSMKLCWSMTQKVQYTSCCLGLVNDKRIHFAVSAFDGSLSFGFIDRLKLDVDQAVGDLIAWEHVTAPYQSSLPDEADTDTV